MTFLQNTFHKTRLFWVISRYFWIFLFTMSIFFVFQEPEGGREMMVVCGAIAVYILLMLTTAISGFRKRELHPGVRLGAGVFSLLFGLLSCVNLFAMISSDAGIFQKILFAMASVWLLLFGLQDVLSFRKPSGKATETKKTA